MIIPPTPESATGVHRRRGKGIERPPSSSSRPSHRWNGSAPCRGRTRHVGSTPGTPRGPGCTTWFIWKEVTEKTYVGGVKTHGFLHLFPDIHWKCLGGSINGGTPKWIVHKGKSHWNGWFGGTPISGNLHLEMVELYWFRMISPELGSRCCKMTRLSLRVPSKLSTCREINHRKPMVFQPVKHTLSKCCPRVGTLSWFAIPIDILG